MSAFDAKGLKHAFANLPPIDEKYGDLAWHRRLRKLRWYVEKKDPARFLNWPTLRASMFAGDVPFIKKLYDELMGDGAADWRKVIAEPGVGEPARLSYAKWTSGNLVLQAQHIKRWMDVTGGNVDALDSIVEIGGGYGALALVCHRLGFRGTYYLHDFPELILLQESYIAATVKGADVVSVADLAQMPPVDLLIAMASWAEMPMKERRGCEGILAASYLVSYKPFCYGNNQDYFGAFRADRPGLCWYDERGGWANKGRYMIGWGNNEAD